MIPILFEASDFATDYDYYGNHMGYWLDETISCIVSRYGTIGWDLELEYPVTGKHYDKLVQRNIICVSITNSGVYELDGPKEPFRIKRIRKTIDGHIFVTAEHIVYDLSGIPVSPFTASTASAAMSGIKSHSMTQNPFTFSSQKSANGQFSLLTPTSAWNILGGMEGSIIDTFGGGEYDISQTNIVLKDRLGSDNGVIIRYGLNMTDFEQDESCANSYTGAVAYWAREVENTFQEVHTDVVNTSGTYDYTNIATYDFTSYFDNKPSKSELTSFLQAYIVLNNIGAPTVSLDVSFVDLSKTLEYADISMLYTVNFGDTVTVQFQKYDINVAARVCETKWDVLKNRYESIRLGDYKPNVADTIAAQGKKINSMK